MKGNAGVGQFFIILTLVTSWLFCESVHHDFLVVAPPDSGCARLVRVVEDLLGKQNERREGFYMAPEELRMALEQCKINNKFLCVQLFPREEILHTLKQMKYKVLFLCRDPRDQAITLLHSIVQNGYALGPLRMCMQFGYLCQEDKLHEIITGKRYGLSGMRMIMAKFLPWIKEDQDFVCQVRFENLNDRDEVDKIAGHLKVLPKPGYRADDVGDTAGGWRSFFTDRHILAFKEMFSGELIEMGYENNREW